MLNLFARMTDVYITDAQGRRKKVIPHYMGSPIPLRVGGQPIQKLTRVGQTMFSPSPGRVGEPVTVVPALYTGTGPIEFVGQLIQGDTVIHEVTSFDPFDFTPPAHGEIVWEGRASGRHPSNPPIENVFLAILAADVPPPEFTHLPSITPSSGEVGDTFTLDPGDGPGLTWTLRLGQIEVKDQVQGLSYVADRAGTLTLESRVYREGLSRAASSTAEVQALPPPTWDVEGGAGSITFRTLKEPEPLTAVGGINSITFNGG